MFYNFKIANFYVFLLMLSCQLTDVTIGVFKVWEVISLIFILNLVTINKRLLVFVLVFFLIFIISILKGLFSEINYEYFSFLKSKYFISISRMTELFLCLVIASVPYHIKVKYNISLNQFLRKFMSYNYLFLLFVFLLYVYDFIISGSIVTHSNSFRLKGFYVEGGPFGLFLAFLFFFELFFLRRLIFLGLIILLIFLTKSKAGYIFVTIISILNVLYGFKFVNRFLDMRNKIATLLFISIVAVIACFLIYQVGYNYVNDFLDLETKLIDRMDDPEFIMGRISAFLIGYNIFLDNYLVGTGIGTYSIVRNNIEYRQFLPYVYEWDLTGLGGLVTLLIENGIVGFVLYIGAVLSFFGHNKSSVLYLIVFCLPMLLGAQVYMIYPWLLLGIYSVFRYQNYKMY